MCQAPPDRRRRPRLSIVSEVLEPVVADDVKRMRLRYAGTHSSRRRRRDPHPRSAVCFVEADWPLIGGAFSTRDVAVVWPKKLAAMLSRTRSLDESSIASVHRRLASAFPEA